MTPSKAFVALRFEVLNIHEFASWRQNAITKIVLINTDCLSLLSNYQAFADIRLALYSTALLNMLRLSVFLFALPARK